MHSCANGGAKGRVGWSSSGWRQQRDDARAAHREALYYDPAHRQAIEYQGELYLVTGRLDKAQENIEALKIFCLPAGCPEFTKLEAAYQARVQGKAAAPATASTR